MRYGKWALCLLVLLALFFLPALLSTQIGKRFLINALEEKMSAAVAIQSLELSWLGPQTLNGLSLENERYTSEVEHLHAAAPLWSLLRPFKTSGDLHLENGSLFLKPSVQLNQVNGTFRLHSGAADFTLSGQSLQNDEPGAFNLQGQISHFDDPTPEFSVSGGFDSFPTRTLALLLKNDALPELLGNTLDARGNASLKDRKGLFNVTLHSPNLDAEAKGQIHEGALTLTDALNATLRLTPALSQTLLKDMNPLFITGLKASNPIQLRIESRGFRYTLGTFSLSNLQIGQATLNAGQIVCKNGGTLASFIGLLKNDRISHTDQMLIWFSPLPFRLQNGVLETGRMDALVADAIHVCTWGKIDLNRQKLDLYLGLPADLLRASFGIRGLTDSFVLKVPLTGTPSSPHLATGEAAAKIAALLASQKTPLHGVINRVLDSEGDVPTAPRPFPWE